nr:oligosaccharide flippase family protein [uncultured Sphaerochaeta sp.]
MNETPETPDNTEFEQEVPLAYRVVRGGMWVAAGSYFKLGFGFLVSLVMVRILAPEDFGVFALGFSIYSLIYLTPKIGIGYAAGQQKDTPGELIGTVLGLNIFSGFLSLAIAVVAIPIFHLLGYSREVISVILAAALVGFSNSIMATAWLLLDKYLLFKSTSVISSIVFPLSYIPAFWLALTGWGYWSLVAQNAAYALLLLGGVWWMAWRNLPELFRIKWRFDRKIAFMLLRFGILMGLASLGGSVVSQFDSFLVGTFVGLASLGFYDRAKRMSQWPNFLLHGITTGTAFFTYSRLQDDKPRLRKTFTMLLWLITTAALPLALAVYAAAPELVSVLYGERWLPSVPFVRIILLCYITRPITENANSLFTAMGRPELATWSTGLEAVIILAAGLLGTFLAGLNGTLAAIVLTYLTGLVVRMVFVSRLISLTFRETLLVPAIGAGAGLLALHLVVNTVNLTAWHSVVLLFVKPIFITLVFYTVQLILQPGLTIERSRYTLSLMLKREDGKPV